MPYPPISSSDVQTVMNLVHYQGDTFIRQVQFQQNVSGVISALDLTGCSFVFSAIRQNDPFSVIMLTESTATGGIVFIGPATAGIVQITIAAALTVIEPGIYTYDLTQTNPDTTVRTRLKGLLTIVQKD